MKEQKSNEEKKAPTAEVVKTPGGMDALLVNGMYIRQSYKGHRLVDDGETYEEYVVRRELTNQHANRQGNLIHVSSKSLGSRIVKNPTPYVKEK